VDRDSLYYYNRGLYNTPYGRGRKPLEIGRPPAEDKEQAMSNQMSVASRRAEMAWIREERARAERMADNPNIAFDYATGRYFDLQARADRGDPEAAREITRRRS
jgi:hypothetical protein